MTTTTMLAAQAATMLFASLVFESAATVRVHVVHAGGRSTDCASAVAVGSAGREYLFATAKHVVSELPADCEKFVISGFRHAPFRVLSMADGNDDVAIIAAELPVSIPAASCADAAPVVGAETVGTGYDHGGFLRAVPTRVDYVDPSTSALLTRVGSVPGRSGGGLFHRGRLVGVCSGYDAQTGQGVYTKASVVRRMLSSLARGR